MWPNMLAGIYKGCYAISVSWCSFFPPTSFSIVGAGSRWAKDLAFRDNSTDLAKSTWELDPRASMSFLQPDDTLCIMSSHATVNATPNWPSQPKYSAYRRLRTAWYCRREGARKVGGQRKGIIALRSRGMYILNGMVYTCGAASDYNNWAVIIKDDGWRWKSLHKNIPRHEKWTLPASGRNVTEESDPQYHGFSGNPNQTEFRYNQDMNSGNPIGLGVSPHAVHGSIVLTVQPRREKQHSVQPLEQERQSLPELDDSRKRDSLRRDWFIGGLRYASETRDSVISNVHRVGSAAMSARGSRRSILDPDLHVKGLDGLRIVDAAATSTVAEAFMVQITIHFAQTFHHVPHSHIALNCLVSGDDADKIFTVQIASNNDVSILKHQIKHVNPNRFANTDVPPIRLFKVSLAIANAEQARDPRNIEGAEELLPIAKISQVFQCPLERHIHIVVLPPPVCHPAFRR
ncbi:hypothetical protein FA15DRAFT_697153 [Coprinopsis marcescibilis]|uniref:Uncharacterized protein n=1 Tax=Coprinopsis marcescibilis TaxID=230819 RepID=A0A5C3KIG2_COPMA|nr:hypothetical protein FA15DRAFT_697153 [Coprinopsis marcescibilis]